VLLRSTNLISAKTARGVIGIPEIVKRQIKFSAILQCGPKLPLKRRTAMCRVGFALQQQRYFRLPVAFPGAIPTVFSSRRESDNDCKVFLLLFKKKRNHLQREFPRHLLTAFIQEVARCLLINLVEQPRNIQRQLMRNLLIYHGRQPCQFQTSSRTLDLITITITPEISHRGHRPPHRPPSLSFTPLANRMWSSSPQMVLVNSTTLPPLLPVLFAWEALKLTIPTRALSMKPARTFIRSECQ